MRLALGILMLALAASVVAWNGIRFRGAERTVRTKDLSFLPSPEVGRMMAFGHANSLAKLRWIDAFAYFQFQLDRKDDTVAGGGRGFERLYDTLIALDPYFVPFYQHAALAVGGILQRHDRELGYVLRGLLVLPHDTTLWRFAAAGLYTNFEWDRRQPQLMDTFLASWSEAELDETQRRQVWDWQAAMARRRFQGLQQLSYWIERLRDTKPRTPIGDYVEATMRDQLATYAINELEAVADDRRAANLKVESLDDLLDVPRLNARQIDAHWGPLANHDGRPVLRVDPYGFPYEFRAGKVVSHGQELRRFERALSACNRQLAGAKAADLDRVKALGVVLPELPTGASLRVQDGRLIAVLPEPPHLPMNLR